MMNITITSEYKKEYLFIESKGVVETKEDLFRHCDLVFTEINKYDVKKILIYEPETEFPLEIYPYFDLINHYINSFPPEIRLLKIAVVTAEKFKEVAETWESLCVSRGFRYYAFTSLKEAEEWLIN
jgi:hypothetical protein